MGPAAKIAAVAREHRLDIGRFEIVDVPHSEAAAAKAVELIHESKGELLMKGSLHTDELMREVTSSKTGLRTARRISHVFIMDVPTYSETLFITDAAINIFPDLDAKRDIVQNAIDLFTQVGLGTPRVAILSAVETVTSKIPSTIEAAALCKMADRGQITGGILDGPLAFDNAIDPEAAKIKGIKSEVAGRAQILVVPDLEAGNMLAKNLAFLAKADAAGIVLGARVPIILTSRADSVRSRMASCAAAVLYADARRRAAALAGGLIAMDTILVVNAGSSSVKFQVFGIEEAGALQRLIKGQIDGIGTRPRLAAEANDKSSLIDRTYAPDKVPDVPAAIAVVASWLRETPELQPCRGRPPSCSWRAEIRPTRRHRPSCRWQISSNTFRSHRCISPTTSRRSATLLTARPELASGRLLRHRLSSRPRCRRGPFRDPRAFLRRGRPPLRVPWALLRICRRSACARSLRTVAAGRVIVAHLGSGASMCALADGRSVESTMGFTALDGIPMGTRPGQIDPGVLLYLITRKGHDADGGPGSALSRQRLERPVRHQQRHAGSGVELRSAARSFAVDYFVYRVGLNAGMLAAALGGLDAFVFTAGIGENSPTMRARIAEKLAWLGVVFDPAANADGKSLISRPESRVALLVVPTDEELMIARHTLALLPKGSAKSTHAARDAAAMTRD